MFCHFKGSQASDSVEGQVNTCSAISVLFYYRYTSGHTLSSHKNPSQFLHVLYLSICSLKLYAFTPYTVVCICGAMSNNNHDNITNIFMICRCTQLLTGTGLTVSLKYLNFWVDIPVTCDKQIIMSLICGLRYRQRNMRR